MDEATARKELEAEGYDNIRLLDWEAGHFVDTHTHEFSAAARVIAGEISVEMADRTVTCSSGDAFQLDANIPHAERVGAEGVKFIVGTK